VVASDDRDVINRSNGTNRAFRGIIDHSLVVLSRALVIAYRIEETIQENSGFDPTFPRYRTDLSGNSPLVIPNRIRVTMKINEYLIPYMNNDNIFRIVVN